MAIAAATRVPLTSFLPRRSFTSFLPHRLLTSCLPHQSSPSLREREREASSLKVMANAAAIRVPLTSPTRRSLTSFLPHQSSPSLILQYNSLRKTVSSCLRLVAAVSSMSVKAAKKASSASFLDRREAGILYFVKYHGNDFILVDNRDSSEPKVTPEQAAKLCVRNFGIDADGVIFALPGINGTDYTTRIFNSDGSPIEPEMYGNGVRCFARSIIELENLHGNQRFTVHASAGLIVPEIVDDGKVRVDMGEPILKASDVPTKLPPNKDHSVVKAGLDVDGVTWNVTCVSMGNPHCITFGTEGGQNLQVDEFSLAEIGPKFEHHEVFPARTNTGSLAVPAPQWKYDVFLSFRGEDTRGGFISHLHHELEKLGIRTFKDEQLEIGEGLSQSLLMAIEESRYAIIVLSKNYAFSPWCLDELRKIRQCMKGKGRILPLYFYVDPSVVRHQKDTFGAALEKHARSGRHGIVKMKQWRTALNKMGDIIGWNTKNHKTERDLIGHIVKFMLKTVRQSTKRGRF